jgi:hypothetical protein
VRYINKYMEEICKYFRNSLVIYIRVTSAPTTHRKHLTRLLLLKRVPQPFHSNGCCSATSIKHSYFYCCVHFEVSMASTVTAWEKHATLFIYVNIDDVLDWWSDLFDSLMRNMWLHPTVYCYTYTYTHIGAQSRVFSAVAWQQLPTGEVLIPLGSRTVPDLSY